MWPACLCASAHARDDQANQPTRATACPHAQKTPASRTQTRIQPKSAANRQNPHFRRRCRSKNATGSVLSDFLRGSGTGDLAIRSDRHARPSQRRRGIRHSRQVKTLPEAYAVPGSKPRPSEEEPPEVYPCRHHSTADSATMPTPGAATTRRVRRAALPVLCVGAGLPVPDADRRLAAEERISRRNPTPQHPQRAANLIAHRRRTSPPDQSRKCSRWGRPGFRRPASNWTPGRPVRAAQPPHVGQGESQANPSRAAPLQDGRQKPTARRKRFIRFAPSRINPGAKPTCARRTSGRQCRGATRMNPVMKIPCRNRPHLLPTARWSGGRAGRRRCDEAEGGASVSAGAYCGRGARSRSDNNTMRGERPARRGARLYSVQFALYHLKRPPGPFCILFTPAAGQQIHVKTA